MFTDSLGSAGSVARTAGSRRPLAFLGRFQFHLIGGLAVAVLLPQLLWFSFQPVWLTPGFSGNTLLGTAVALIAGAYFLRQVSRYPGVAATAPVLPAFATSYAAVISFFFFLRVDY